MLSLDGSSQTLITVEARDANGQPAPNVPLRVEILADGQAVDFGTISARTLVTGSNGRATFTYTAPSFVGGAIPRSAAQRDADRVRTRPRTSDESSPSGSCRPASSAARRPRGFTFLPTNPAAFTDVRFDGSTSTAGLGAVITSYVWDFGDGTSGTGVTATHQYDAAGNYLVRLTVTDSNGVSNQSAAQTVTVGGGHGADGRLRVLADEPLRGQTVFFNATHVHGGRWSPNRQLRLELGRRQRAIGLDGVARVHHCRDL